MQYFISFLEGIITFISPCLLPMLPVYLSYIAGEPEPEETNLRKVQSGSSRIRTLNHASGFILGFTVMFVCMGALAGSLGNMLRRFHVLVNLAAGAVVAFFGLSILGFFHLNFFRGIRVGHISGRGKGSGWFSAFLFGITFSVGWTPCVGAFLGSALALASQMGSVRVGILMLLCYSFGLGIPFVASALLIDYLKSAFTIIKKHYGAINRVCGILLVTIGLLMMTGIWEILLNLLS